jgi:cephalosporin hydroxylase
VILLNIVTALSRPKNIPVILRSMEGLRQIPNLRVRWIIVYDSQAEAPKEVMAPGPLPTSLEIVPVAWTHGPCRFGVNQKNFGMDHMEPGFYHLLDDDNIVHPSFFSRLVELIQKHPEKKAFGFNQKRWDHHGDFPCRADKMVPGKIDNTMFVVSTDFIGSKRYDLARAGMEDGWFFHELFHKDQNAWFFSDEWLTYYNYLAHHKVEPVASATPTLDVFIVTYRSDQYLPSLLADLKATSKIPCNLKVVDNTGNKKTLTALWNDLWKASSAEYIAFLNPDIKVSPGWDERLLECLQKRPDVGIALANRYFPMTGRPDLHYMKRVSGEYTNQTRYQDLGEHLEGFYAFMTRRSVLQSLKGFDERFRFYFADSNFQLRALRVFGLKTTQVNYCLIAHIGAVSTQEADRLGEIDRQAEFRYVEETRAQMRSGNLRVWHELSDQERAEVRQHPIYSRMPVKGQVQSSIPSSGDSMKLIIDNIYSPEGRKALTDAYTKSYWADKLYHRVTWLGAPLLQIPEDLIAMAQLIWSVKPKLIIECGIWQGGGLLFYSSILNLIGQGSVIGVDVGTAQAEHVKTHPQGNRISIIQGSSASQEVAQVLGPRAAASSPVILILDSNHTAEHVRNELKTLSPLVGPGGYVVVMDGIMKIFHDVPGGEAQPEWATNNPETAVSEFLKSHPEFERDISYNQLGTTHAPGGFLRRK